MFNTKMGSLHTGQFLSHQWQQQESCFPNIKYHGQRQLVWKSGRDHSPSIQNVHFWFLSEAQECYDLKIS